MAIWDPLFIGTDLNEVGTALRTPKLISLGYLPDPECPKCGPTGAKKGAKIGQKIAFLPQKLAQRAHFGLEGVEKGWNTNKDIQTDYFGPFATPRMSQMRPYEGRLGPKIG